MVQSVLANTLDSGTGLPACHGEASAQGALNGRAVTQGDFEKSNFKVLKAASSVLKSVGRFFSSLFVKGSSSDGNSSSKWTMKRKIKVGLSAVCTVGLVILGIKATSLLIPIGLCAAGLYASMYYL